jgi:hypothetical protein
MTDPARRRPEWAGEAGSGRSGISAPSVAITLTINSRKDSLAGQLGPRRIRDQTLERAIFISRHGVLPQQPTVNFRPMPKFTV